MVDFFAKDKLKSFLMKESGRYSQEKYGLLNLLKCHLKSNYNSHDTGCK